MVKTGLLVLDDQVQEVGSIVGCVLAHVDDMLAAGTFKFSSCLLIP